MGAERCVAIPQDGLWWSQLHMRINRGVRWYGWMLFDKE